MHLNKDCLQLNVTFSLHLHASQPVRREQIEQACHQPTTNCMPLKIHDLLHFRITYAAQASKSTVFAITPSIKRGGRLPPRTKKKGILLYLYKISYLMACPNQCQPTHVIAIYCIQKTEQTEPVLTSCCIYMKFVYPHTNIP